MFNILNFKSSLEKISKNVIENKLIINTEEQTKVCIILPFLQALGYDITNPRVVKLKYKCENGTRTTRADLAIIRDNEIYMIIKIKSLDHKLSNKDKSQLSNYFTLSSSKIGLLTNGSEFYFYNANQENQKMSCFPYIQFNITDLKSNDYVINQLSQLAYVFSGSMKKTPVSTDKTENDIDGIISYVRERVHITGEELLKKFSKKAVQMALMRHVIIKVHKKEQVIVSLGSESDISEFYDMCRKRG